MVRNEVFPFMQPRSEVKFRYRSGPETRVFYCQIVLKKRIGPRSKKYRPSTLDLRIYDLGLIFIIDIYSIISVYLFLEHTYIRKEDKSKNNHNEQMKTKKKMLTINKKRKRKYVLLIFNL